MLCKSQPGRAALDHIGMHTGNRGGHGVISFHLHRNVLPDVLENGTIADRYAPVRLVEVPQASLDKWRQENKRRCDDPLMPKFSPEMKYCLLTKHHFVHSHKLIKDGDRTVFNEGKLPAKLRDYDDEGKMVQSVGVKAVIYGPELWDDPAALNAIMTADNIDADCRWIGETEVDALGDLLVLPMNGGDEHGEQLILKDEISTHTDKWPPASPLNKYWASSQVSF